MRFRHPSKEIPCRGPNNDLQIQSAVLVFNAFLAGKGFFAALDWRVIKAMAWVETGPYAPDKAWEKRPMQIGNFGDPGLHDLLTSTQGSLIIPLQLRAGLNEVNCSSEGRFNIIVGIAYLLRRLARFGIVLDPVPSCEARSYRPVLDSKSIVGLVEHPLSDCVMDKLTGERISVNKPLAPYKPQHSQHDRYTYQPQQRAASRKAHMAIVGWKPFSFEFASKYYNGGGDGNYAAKVEYAFKIIAATP